MAGNTAINVAKLQEQLAKNTTIYSTTNDHKEQTSTTDESNSVTFFNWKLFVFLCCSLLTYLFNCFRVYIKQKAGCYFGY